MWPVSGELAATGTLELVVGGADPELALQPHAGAALNQRGYVCPDPAFVQGVEFLAYNPGDVHPRNVRKPGGQAVDNLINAGFFRIVSHSFSVGRSGPGVNEILSRQAEAATGPGSAGTCQSRAVPGRGSGRRSGPGCCPSP